MKKLNSTEILRNKAQENFVVSFEKSNKIFVKWICLAILVDRKAMKENCGRTWCFSNGYKYPFAINQARVTGIEGVRTDPRPLKD